MLKNIFNKVTKCFLTATLIGTLILVNITSTQANDNKLIISDFTFGIFYDNPDCDGED